MKDISELDEYPGVPDHLFHGLKLYASKRIRPGSFLYAVLCNNLFEAMGRADTLSQISLKAITMLIYNCMPGNCWGSEDKVKEWLRGN